MNKLVTRGGGWISGSSMVAEIYMDQSVIDLMASFLVANVAGQAIDTEAMSNVRMLMLHAPPLQAGDLPVPVAAAAYDLAPGKSAAELGAGLPVVAVRALHSLPHIAALQHDVNVAFAAFRNVAVSRLPNSR
jgi:hypothetical protein